MREMFDKMKNLFAPQEDEYDDEDDFEEMEQPVEPVHKHRPTPVMPHVQPQTHKVLPITQAQNKMEILNFSMANDDKTGDISQYIKNRKPIIVNMQQLDPSVRQRVVDYLTGACEALNGSVGKVADDILIFAPENVNITADQVKEKANWQNF
ncbi:MAG: cell division protein SepF [Cellulosilyticaceae bacterium]